MERGKNFTIPINGFNGTSPETIEAIESWPVYGEPKMKALTLEKVRILDAFYNIEYQFHDARPDDDPFFTTLKEVRACIEYLNQNLIGYHFDMDRFSSTINELVNEGRITKLRYKRYGLPK